MNDHEFLRFNFRKLHFAMEGWAYENGATEEQQDGHSQGKGKEKGSVSIDDL